MKVSTYLFVALYLEDIFEFRLAYFYRFRIL